MQNQNEIPKKQELNNSGSLSLGHAAIVLGCAVFLLGISYMKSGFDFKLKKNIQTKKYTYAEAKAKAIAQAGSIYLPETNSSSELAVLDSEYGAGQVAGASINALGDLGIPSAEESWSKEDLEKIPVRTTSDNSAQAMQTYRDTMEALEMKYDLAYITFALNSDDAMRLKEAGSKAEEMVKASVTVLVPSELALYHKFRNIQYMEMGMLAKSLSGENVGIETKDLSTELFSVIEKLGRMKAETLEKYNLEI